MKNLASLSECSNIIWIRNISIVLNRLISIRSVSILSATVCYLTIYYQLRTAHWIYYIFSLDFIILLRVYSFKFKVMNQLEVSQWTTINTSVLPCLVLFIHTNSIIFGTPLSISGFSLFVFLCFVAIVCFNFVKDPFCTHCHAFEFKVINPLRVRNYN